VERDLLGEEGVACRTTGSMWGKLRQKKKKKTKNKIRKAQGPLNRVEGNNKSERQVRQEDKDIVALHKPTEK